MPFIYCDELEYKHQCEEQDVGVEYVYRKQYKKNKGKQGKSAGMKSDLYGFFKRVVFSKQVIEQADTEAGKQNGYDSCHIHQ